HGRRPVRAAVTDVARGPLHCRPPSSGRRSPGPRRRRRRSRARAGRGRARYAWRPPAGVAGWFRPHGSGRDEKNVEGTTASQSTGGIMNGGARRTRRGWLALLPVAVLIGCEDVGLPGRNTPQEEHV